jgi:ribosome recycling factor
MIEDVLAETEDKMKKATEALKREMQNIRTGRASAGLVERIQVEYYGTNTPLNQMATITVPEPRTIMIQPWDKSAMGAIEKAIQKSELNLNPNNDGKVVRVVLPALTQDRRKELVKVVKGKVEECKVAVRNIRRDHISDLKELLSEKMITEDEEKRAVDRIQQLTDRFTHEADVIGQHKEQEILEV